MPSPEEHAQHRSCMSDRPGGVRYKCSAADLHLTTSEGFHQAELRAATVRERAVRTVTRITPDP